MVKHWLCNCKVSFQSSQLWGLTSARVKGRVERISTGYPMASSHGVVLISLYVHLDMGSNQSEYRHSLLLIIRLTWWSHNWLYYLHYHCHCYHHPRYYSYGKNLMESQLFQKINSEFSFWLAIGLLDTFETHSDKGHYSYMPYYLLDISTDNMLKTSYLQYDWAQKEWFFYPHYIHICFLSVYT